MAVATYTYVDNSYQRRYWSPTTESSTSYTR